jgi:WD40 repeat protein
MQISMKLLEGDFPWSPSTSLPMYDTVLASPKAKHLEDAGPITIIARDWLLSGSRDLTLRLWNLASPNPKVVKVFYGGHTGSVLSLDVVRVPVPRSERAKLAPQGSPARRAGLSGAEALSRVMAISAGGDGRLCLWDIEHGDGKPEKVVQAHEEAVYCVRADDERIVSCSKGESAPLSDQRDSSPHHNLPADIIC